MFNNDKVRDIPGWGSNAPIPICMDGDHRALTFCCKPGHSLTFGNKCRRDKKLSEIGLSEEDFISIKEKFSIDNDWNSNIVCFGSLSYCCMRRRGCSKRDLVLENMYPNLKKSERLELYFRKKKELSRKILESIDKDEKNKVKVLLDLF